MFSLEVESDSDGKDLLVAELWEQGSTGIIETDLPEGRCLLQAFFDVEADSAELVRRFGGKVERHAPRDWVEFSQANWEPLAVGARFYLVPQWRDDPAPPGRIRIEINPGLACGTGFHEATQLCLEAIEEYQQPDMTVLDVGAGSAILSIASALLGAGRVVACDLDPVAVEVAAGNVRRAGVDVVLFTGSADAIRPGSIDLLVANISAAAAIDLAPQFLRCLAPGGRYIASGYESLEAVAVEAATERARGVITRRLSKNDWRGLVATRRLSHLLR
jgi:ribosomal protein L11 methyltransferase